MLIRVASDLHLEFGENYEDMLPSMMEDKDTILVLAGDIHMGVQATCEFLPHISHRFAEVIYVLGNHEFYQNDIATLAEQVREEISDLSNVHLLDDDTIVLNGTRFIGSTLWTSCAKGNPSSILIVEGAMNDYHLIRRNGKKLRVTDTMELHDVAVAFLEDELGKEHDGPSALHYYAPNDTGRVAANHPDLFRVRQSKQ